MSLADLFPSSLSPLALGRIVRYRVDNYIRNPDYFSPFGCALFCGPQGSGKSYSAVVYVYHLMRLYPKCLLCTNLKLFGLFDDFKNRVEMYHGPISLRSVRNGTDGVIFLIDEMHIEFNSLESKNMPISIFEDISQQRKQRCHIVGTAQVFGRLAKPFREQMYQVIFCKNYLGALQYNSVVDGLTIKQMQDKYTGKVLRKYFLVHDARFYDSFDTYDVIKRSRL